MTSSTADKYTTTEYGKQNMFAAEAQPWIDEKIQTMITGQLQNKPMADLL